MTDQFSENLSFEDNKLLITLCGELDRNLISTEEILNVKIHRLGNKFTIYGPPAACGKVKAVLSTLYNRAEKGLDIDLFDVELECRRVLREQADDTEVQVEKIQIRTRSAVVEPRTLAQVKLCRSIFRNEMVIASGPSGSGKSYLAFACASQLILSENVDKINIILCQKVLHDLRYGQANRTLQPVDIYPAVEILTNFIPANQIRKMLSEKAVTFMSAAEASGRTFDRSVSIFDDAHLGDFEEIETFITRHGRTSKSILLGNWSQRSPSNEIFQKLRSALLEKPNSGIGIVTLGTDDILRSDVVRHISDILESIILQKNS